MTEANEQLLSAARAYVTDIYNHRMPGEIVFHTIEHTEDVVSACSHMADYYQVPEEDRLVLLLAAWFHDVGYSTGKAEGHEDVSIDMATNFLESRHVSEETVKKVVSCIQATRMPQSPISTIEKILCDADLAHLGSEDFSARSQLLKQERENISGQKIDKKEWRKSNINFFATHQYFTSYGNEILEPRKLENLTAMQQRNKKSKGSKSDEQSELYPYTTTPKHGDEKENNRNVTRGIQTMFRVTSNNHIELSSLADGKANIMISVNAIIISVVLTVLLVRLPYYPQYMIPTVILVTGCLGAMIFAILATRPSVNIGRFTEEDIRNKRANLLFFGNFFRMKLEQYEWGMNEMLKNHDYLYSSMIKDIYFLGVVLAKKYRLLRISYTIFMWGLIAAVISFAFAAITSDVSTTTRGPIIDY